MSHFDQEDMTILYKYPRALHCKNLVNMPFSKTPNADWKCDYFPFDFCFFVLCIEFSLCFSSF